MTQEELPLTAGTQCERLLAYLATHPITGITFVESWQELGILQPARRICELRKRGHNITTKMVDVSNRYGETCSIARYKLEMT
jgi:hypothetical protein